MSALIAVVACLIAGSQEFKLDPTSGTPAEHDMTPSLAAEKARSWLKVLGTAPTNTAYLGYDGNAFDGTWTCVFLRDNVEVGLESRTGRLRFYSDLSSKIGTTFFTESPSLSIFENESEERARCRMWLSKLVDGSEFRESAYTTSNRGQLGQFAPWSTVDYRIDHLGRRCFGPYAQVTIDVRDGRLVHMILEPEYVIRDEEPKLNKDAAKTLAGSAYLDALRDARPNPPSVDKSPELIYARYDASDRTKLTVAYMVSFGSDTVTIDGITGKCLAVALPRAKTKKAGT